MLNALDKELNILCSRSYSVCCMRPGYRSFCFVIVSLPISIFDIISTPFSFDTLFTSNVWRSDFRVLFSLFVIIKIGHSTKTDWNLLRNERTLNDWGKNVIFGKGTSNDLLIYQSSDFEQLPLIHSLLFMAADISNKYSCWKKNETAIIYNIL